MTGDGDGDGTVAEGPGALVAEAVARYADDDLDGARASYEAAFAALREAGELRRAARVAAALASLVSGPLGQEAVGRGWALRARRLLDEVGPCVEEGYVELALLACDRPDVDDLAASAERALEVARAYGDAALEARALADSSLALVSQGRAREGLARLDEVLAALSAGEVTDAGMIGTSLCSLLTSCDRLRDLDRALESIRVAEALLLGPMDGRPRVLQAHCRVAYGSVMWGAGRLDEAEAALQEVLGPGGSRSHIHRVQALARLADLRLDQGRVDEAAQLLAAVEDVLEVAGPLARAHLWRGDADLAAAVLRRALTRMAGDALRGGPLAALLVDAELARGDLDAAVDAAVLLRSMAAAVELAVVSAWALVADGRVAVARGDGAAARQHFEGALVALGDGQHPLLVATVHLHLADVLAAEGDTAAAVASARSAHAAARRIQAAATVDRAAATLRGLGVAPPRAPQGGEDLAGLTARERDVLAGIQQGQSNAEIAAVLHLSPKTVEHHVGRILAKLGTKTRAEAAAVAARAGG